MGMGTNLITCRISYAEMMMHIPSERLGVDTVHGFCFETPFPQAIARPLTEGHPFDSR